jgi:hypothetical protein
MRGISHLAPVATVLAVIWIYGVFLYTIGQSGILLRATLLEGGVLVLQLGRLLAFATLKEWRETRPAAVLNVFGADVLVLPALAVLYRVVGDRLFLTMVYQIEFSWFLGVTIAATPFVAYRLLRSMLQRNSLASVLPAAVALLEIELVLVATASSLTLTSSPIDFGVNILLLAVGHGAFTLPSSLAAVAFPALILGYLSLLAYAIIYTGPGFERETNRLLTLSIVVTLMTCAAALGSRELALGLVLFLAPPTLLLSLSTWWFTRAK